VLDANRNDELGEAGFRTICYKFMRELQEKNKSIKSAEFEQVEQKMKKWNIN